MDEWICTIALMNERMKMSALLLSSLCWYVINGCDHRRGLVVWLKNEWYWNFGVNKEIKLERELIKKNTKFHCFWLRLTRHGTRCIKRINHRFRIEMETLRPPERLKLVGNVNGNSRFFKQQFELHCCRWTGLETWRQENCVVTNSGRSPSHWSFQHVKAHITGS